MGSRDPTEFLDWVHTIGHILEFKQVPDDRRVGLIATQFRGCTTTWWQQIRHTRTRQGRSKIATWPKLQKHLHREFLPFNYRSTLFQSLHNLRQGSQTVAEYAADFHQLIARVDVGNSPEQLAARFLAGLRPNYQDTLNLLGPSSLFEALQHAAQIEKQQARKAFSPFTDCTSSLRQSSTLPSASNNSSRPLF